MKRDPGHRGRLTGKDVFEAGDRRYILLDMVTDGGFDGAPGRFVMLDTGDAHFLDRPFSLLDLAEKEGKRCLRLLIEVKGSGTRDLLSKKPGDLLEIKGPYGNRITEMEGRGGITDVIVGGMGIVPVYFLIRKVFEGPGEDLSDGRLSVFFGAGSQEFFDMLIPRLPLPGGLWEDLFHFVPFDSSQRTVVEYYREYVGDRGVEGDRVISCGPGGMLRSVQDYILEKDITGELVLERRMACGRGMCMGCSVKIAERSNTRRELVCGDGPVFTVGNGKKVVF